MPTHPSNSSLGWKCTPDGRRGRCSWHRKGPPCPQCLSLALLACGLSGRTGPRLPMFRKSGDASRVRRWNAGLFADDWPSPCAHHPEPRPKTATGGTDAGPTMPTERALPWSSAIVQAKRWESPLLGRGRPRVEQSHMCTKGALFS